MATEKTDVVFVGVGAAGRSPAGTEESSQTRFSACENSGMVKLFLAGLIIVSHEAKSRHEGTSARTKLDGDVVYEPS